MTKIKNYVVNSTPHLNDKLIGTDVNSSNFTKNFRLGDIVSLVAEQMGIVTTNQLVSGSAVWLEGLIYEVSDLAYCIR